MTTQAPTTTYLTLQKAAESIPSSHGGSTHPATLTRWIRFGARAADGTRIKLQATRFPSGWRVTREALDAFVARLTVLALGNDAEPTESPDAPVLAARQRHLDRIDRELDEAFGTASEPTRARRTGRHRKVATAG